MSLFEQLGMQRPQSQQSQQMDPRQMQQQMQQEVGQIKAHPGSYLKGKGYNIPDGMTDAKEITQYLLQTGQVGAPRLRQVVSMLGGGRR
jgi:hypothetical protein